MKHLTITITFAVVLFSGCAMTTGPGPYNAPTRQTITEDCGTAEECAGPPTVTAPPVTLNPTSAEYQACLDAGGTREGCLNPPPPPSGPPSPPDADSAEGGSVDTSPAGEPYYGD